MLRVNSVQTCLDGVLDGEDHQCGRHKIGGARKEHTICLSSSDIAVQECEQRMTLHLGPQPFILDLILFEPRVHQHAVKVSVLLVSGQDRSEESPQQSLVIVTVHEALKLLHEVRTSNAGALFECGRIEVILRRKVLEDRYFTDAGGFGERPRRGAFEAMAPEQRDGGLDDRPSLGSDARPRSR